MKVETRYQDNFGQVKSLHYYQNKGNRSFTHFFIVQFLERDSVRRVLEAGQHSGEESSVAAVPVFSPFLWLQGAEQGQQGISSKSKRGRADNVHVDFGMQDKISLEQMVRRNKL